MNDRAARLGIRWPDLVLAAVVTGIVVLGSIHGEINEAGETHIDGIAIACGVVGAVALAGWRRLTVAMVGVVAIGTFIYLVRNYPGGPALLPGPIAMLLLGYRARRPVAWVGAAVVAAVVIVGPWIGEGGFSLASVIATGWSIAAVLGGQLIAARGERAAAERERQRFQQHQAIADERLRIAQDLHDSIAHAMATINVQAGVAAHLLDRKPEQAHTALEAIRAASSDVLDELGAILGVLRHGEHAGAPRTPVAGLDRLDELVGRARADGLVVECEVRGDVATVVPSLSTAAYRVVQEALSNSRRHAGPDTEATVTVTIDGPNTIAVDVVDDGGRRPANGAVAVAVGTTSGLGLVGMRERVESTGGALITGRRGGPGFRVTASWNGRHA